MPNNPTSSHPYESFEERLIGDYLDQFENAHSVIGAHGFITAVTMSPVRRELEDWLPQLLDEEPTFASNEESEAIKKALKHIASEVEHSLNSGELPDLPISLEWSNPDRQEAIEDWCVGFMDGVFLDDQVWHRNQEEDVAHLLLPMVAISNVIEDPELEKLMDDEKKAQSLANQIRENLLDLYLILHQEEE